MRHVNVRYTVCCRAHGLRPLIGIQKGVTRQVTGHPETLHGAKERVTVDQMIEACTRGGAYQLKADDRLGSITCGEADHACPYRHRVWGIALWRDDTPLWEDGRRQSPVRAARPMIETP